MSSKLETVTSEDWFPSAYLDWMERFKCLEKGCNTLKEASPSTLSQFQFCGGLQNLVWKEGFSGLFNVLMKKHPMLKGNDKCLTEDNFKLGTEVTEIKWSGNRLAVKCSNNNTFHCDHVIVTVSLGVLKEKVKTLFKPPLPFLHHNAINGLGIGTVNKIYLNYTSQWWPDDCSGFCFLEPKDSTKKLSNEKTNWENDIVGFFTEFGTRNTLCAWVVGGAAVNMELCSDEEVAKACTRVLNNFLGDKYDIPEPNHMTRSKWFSNPHFRGSYSFRSTITDKFKINTSVLRFPVINWDKPMILFAGEATSEKFFSTTHGALETGLKAADCLINFYKTDPVVDWPKVIIIGAGIAGLAAARTLIKGGVNNIKIFEAQKEPGGRIKSFEYDNGIIELGAQWIHSPKNKLYEIAKKRKLISSSVSDEGLGLYVRPGGQIVSPDLVKEVKDDVENILSECEKFKDFSDISKCPISVGHYLESKFNQLIPLRADRFTKEIKKELLDWHIRFQLIDNSCSNLDDLSAISWGQYVTEGQSHINLKNGYSSIIKYLLADIPSQCVETSKSVKSIKWKTNVENYTKYPCEIICDDGDSWKASHIIVTASIGYLQQNTELFDPHLPPNHQQALECFGFSVINKIFLKYNEPWWGNTKGIQLVYNSCQGIKEFDMNGMDWTKGITGFDTVSENPSLLLVWVGGEGASKMEKLTQKQVAVHCTLLLRKFTGKADIPFPDDVIRSTWGSNKYICGGYSHITVKADKHGICPNETLLKPVLSKNGKSWHPSLLFAGEAVHKNQFSTAHGAYESGEFQALQLLSFLKKKLS
ncbi:peroxisomal N(1)-acetyl-spermine/spermidine oxidase-like isoform X2 [Cimex lectularius]|nr:peroxisomal N(1)-acetyl-spermine/spermidine oxidase-like isoform X2 [Cimex lectularius]